MASILQSIMEPYSPFRTRKSLAKSPLTKFSVTESSITEFSVIEPSIIEFFFNESSQPKSNWAVNHLTAARIQALTLAEKLQTFASMEKDIAVKIATAQSNIGEKTVLRYMRTARLWGYNPAVSTVIKEEYVTDAPRLSCPPKATPEVEARLLAAGNILSFLNYDYH